MVRGRQGVHREQLSSLRLRCHQSRPRPCTARSHHSLVWGSHSLPSARRKRHATACFHLPVRAAATWMDGAWGGSLCLCSQIFTVNKIIFKKAHITCLKENIEYFKEGSQKQTKLAMVEPLINASGALLCRRQERTHLSPGLPHVPLNATSMQWSHTFS